MLLNFALLFFNVILGQGLLYPQRNIIRGLDSLDGLWTFVLEDSLSGNAGIINKWYQKELRNFINATNFPVPAAFNELFNKHKERDHIGWVWYQTTYYRRKTDATKRLLLRFGSVNYHAIVYVNGEKLTEHIGGHLPFETELPINTTEYKITVAIRIVQNNEDIDIYTESFGFRSVEKKGNQIYVNGKQFYCYGFGMHEDYDLNGRGYSPVVMTKDLNMFEWLNANCYRTSHYPYSEERAYEADRRGIMVITETLAVALNKFNDKMKNLHQQMISETILRDQNHPSVFAWSLANEPSAGSNGSIPYFKALADYTRTLDDRPVGIALGVGGDFGNRKELIEPFDFFGINHYEGWYKEMNHLEVVPDGLYDSIKSSYNAAKDKVLYLTEYGAEALPGLSNEQSAVFSEQCQKDLIEKSFKALERARTEGILAGEMIWNYADFMTYPSLTRPYGNHKGVLTRQRKPKLSAYLVQERYKHLSDNPNNQKEKL
ncbi:unnamed protein product [Bursaphelenchus okinawaensis]|uniref:Beta-glucuronidase n=1 Tax=Bursaphelenchus okinawaensis TaxID=465554 RepID=A0A811L6U8_9BILA|nr:unnamed protein product [Bursaphelenchus okinawaensis]CAG9119414.1 unnamed protein product [Bursaphelenchus okinawaensis]